MPVADKNTRNVTLAGQDFVMKRIPMARMRSIAPSLQKIMSELRAEITPEQAQEQGGLIGIIMNKLTEIPHEILSLFIKNLPKDIFEDEENGVTFPEFYETLLEALELNRLDVLKSFFTKAAPLLLQATALPKTN